MVNTFFNEQLLVAAFMKCKSMKIIQFAIFKPLSHCFEETTGFDVKASPASRPLSRLIR